MTRAARWEALRLLVVTATLRPSPVSVGLVLVAGVLLAAVGAGAAAVVVDWALRRLDRRGGLVVDRG